MFKLLYVTARFLLFLLFVVQKSHKPSPKSFLFLVNFEWYVRVKIKESIGQSFLAYRGLSIKSRLDDYPRAKLLEYSLDYFNLFYLLSVLNLNHLRSTYIYI